MNDLLTQEAITGELVRLTDTVNLPSKTLIARVDENGSTFRIAFECNDVAVGLDFPAFYLTQELQVFSEVVCAPLATFWRDQQPDAMAEAA